MTFTLAQMHDHLDEVLQQAAASPVVIEAEGVSFSLQRINSDPVPRQVKRLGARLDPNFKPSEAFWDPLPEEELRLWEDHGD